MFREGTALESLEGVDSRRFLPHALAATALVIVAPAAVVIALSPLSGIADLLVSALLATGLSVVAGSALALAWTRLPVSRELPFGDLMLWAWLRRVRDERSARLALAGGMDDPDTDLAALRRLAVVFEARAGATHGHSGRVARHAVRIARRLGLSDEDVARIEVAAALHEIGLVSAPRTILAAGERTSEERAVLDRHAIAGADRVAAVADAGTAALVRHSRERFDGGGRPAGLAGDDIPIGARVLAVADRLDELLSPPPGGRPPRRRNALDELVARARDGELDPDVVSACVAYYSGTRAIAGVALAATAPQRAVRWLAAAPAGIGAAAGGGPTLVQGVCAAGAIAVAGTCIGAMPTIQSGGGDRPAGKQAERAVAPTLAEGSSALAVAVEDAHDGGGRGDGGGQGDLGRAGGRTGTRRGDGPGDRGRSPGGGVPPAGGPGSGAPAPVRTPPPPSSSDPGRSGEGDGTAGTGGTGGTGGRGGTGGSGGTAEPPSSTGAPAPPVPAPQGPIRQTLGDTTTKVVDPVLDSLGDTVPVLQPVTDTARGLLGGLTGRSR